MVRRGHAVGLAVQPLRGKHRARSFAVEFQQLAAIKLRQGDQVHLAVGAKQAMERINARTDQTLGTAAAVAAVPHRTAKAMLRAFLAHMAVPHQDAVGAENAEVVQRLHRRNMLFEACLEHRRADGQQGVMHMHQIHLFFADQGAHFPHGFGAVDGPQGQQQFLGQAAGIIIALIGDHAVAVGLQHGALRGKHGVLAAGQAVVAVHQQNSMRLFRLRHLRPPFPA